MHFIGQLEHGMYTDDCAGLSAEEIGAHYGTDGLVQTRQPGQSGAGHLDDEDVPQPSDEEASDEEDLDPDWQEAEAQLGAGFSDKFLPDTVKTPKHACPLTDEQKVVFAQALHEVSEAGIVPAGYGIRPEEWEDNEYPSYEVIRSNRRGQKDLRVALPDGIWRPRALLWVQSLATMQQLQYMAN